MEVDRLREVLAPPLRAAAWTAFFAGLVLLFLNPMDLGRMGNLISIMAGAVAIAIVTAWVTSMAIGKEIPEPEFRRIVDRSEALAAMPPPEYPPSDFDEIVIQALDELPERFQELLHETPVIVSNRGAEVGAYGHYIGGTIARDGFADRIVIYQDTLERDFGHYPDMLRAQVVRTVRHEIAHHLGWDEEGVRNLGL
jgi:predicted Zn-dependent protease with MMP-like domain